MFTGFRQFILRGNVIDLAVGIMIGAAFNGVVTALVKDILTPLVAAIFKQPDFSNLILTVHGSKITYGDFLNNVISFVVLALAVYFFVVVPINKFNERRKGPPPPKTTKTCPECLSNIPVDATRCAYCTTKLSNPAPQA
jgi:large conductance mechanosensitive channel